MNRRIQLLLTVVVLCSVHAYAEAPANATSSALLADPDRIPIGVWLQDPANALKYKAIGINCYVGLWTGPTQEQLVTLENARMPVMCDQNEEGLKPRWNHEIIGWLQEDEPDNAQELPNDAGYGPPLTPKQVLARYRAMKTADPTRPVHLGLGQGVAWDGWFGRGVRTNKPENYPQYVKAGDIIAFDIYPVVHDQKEIAGKLEYVGRGVDRLVNWTQGKKPVWACIECTRISNPNVKPTPQQVRAEVWMALIHGARGIDYFVHQFKPNFVEAALLQDQPMCEAIRQLNAQIEELAPVLNSPVPEKSATWDVLGNDPGDVSGKNAPAIAAITRGHGGATYVFAVGMTGEKVTATFHLDSVQGGVEVIGENRHIEISNLQWTDVFDGYQAHLYRLSAPGSD
jgi:hypothetical protein